MKIQLVFFLVLILEMSTPFFAKEIYTKSSSDLSVQAMDGNDYNVNKILANGQNVALIFWQSWCAPCLRKMPSLVQAANSNIDQIHFLGVISGRDEDVDGQKVQKIVKKYTIPFPQIRDRDLSITRKYGITETPTIIILGKDMSVLYKSNRLPKDWSKYHFHVVNHEDLVR